MGGNLINFPGNCGTPTADLLTGKFLLNSVISTPGGKFMCIDVENFHLNTLMKRFEYFRMKLEDISDGVIQQYKLKDKEKYGFIYCKVKKGMYGLP